MPDYELVKRLVAALLALRETHNHHGPAVASLAVKLAAVAGLPTDQVDLIEVGAHLHDIGKVLIRKDLLNMPRKLTGEEKAEMRLHTTYGYIIAEQAGFDPVICDMIRHHHERYDGNGYPDRLAGEGIPLEARIISICDSYEALTHQRSYRSAYSDSFARSFMLSETSHQYDPQLLDLFFGKVVQERRRSDTGAAMKDL
jgi:putative nucleotidyltransferase with HDIG domain